MLRRDGNYRIYIIKHLWKDNPKNEWSNSGDCGQWFAKAFPANMDKRDKFYKKYKDIFNPFQASGECWQMTGVHGSFVKADALIIIDKISEWNPVHRFRVCAVDIKQKTEHIMEFKFTPYGD